MASPALVTAALGQCPIHPLAVHAHHPSVHGSLMLSLQVV